MTKVLKIRADSRCTRHRARRDARAVGPEGRWTVVGVGRPQGEVVAVGRHTGKIRVRHSAPAGTGVEVWVGPDGDASSTSTGRENAVIAGFVTAAGLLLGGAVLLGMAWYGVSFLRTGHGQRVGVYGNAEATEGQIQHEMNRPHE